jgi:hypothetical protein
VSASGAAPYVEAVEAFLTAVRLYGVPQYEGASASQADEMKGLLDAAGSRWGAVSGLLFRAVGCLLGAAPRCRRGDRVRPAQGDRLYQRLGLEFPDDLVPEGHGHVETTLPGGLRFTLDTQASIRSFDPDWSPPLGGQAVAVAFRCESPSDVAASTGTWSSRALESTRSPGMRFGVSATRS